MAPTTEAILIGAQIREVGEFIQIAELKPIPSLRYQLLQGHEDVFVGPVNCEGSP